MNRRRPKPVRVVYPVPGKRDLILFIRMPRGFTEKFASHLKGLYKAQIVGKRTLGRNRATIHTVNDCIAKKRYAFVVIKTVGRAICNRYGQWAKAESGIRVMHTETFLRSKYVFDESGLHYTRQSDVRKYISLPPDQPILAPKYTGKRQRGRLAPEQVRKACGVKPGQKVVVVFGQPVTSDCLAESTIPGVKGYRHFLTELFKRNKHTRFLVKPHPSASARMCGLSVLPRNASYIKENLFSLFDTFDTFVTWSSICAFEGLVKNKQFMTAGFHFCSDPRLVYMPTGLGDLKDIYAKIRAHTIDEKARKQNLIFMLNYYAIAATDRERIRARFTLSAKEYYSRVYALPTS